MGNIWRTTVMEAVSLFRDGLIAMIPIAERAKMAWREPDAYDDWDRIAEALFQSLVADALENASECSGWPTLTAYDLRVPKYDNTQAYLFDSTEGPSSPFICLETVETPFDTCSFAKTDAAGTVGSYYSKPISAVSFRAIAGFGSSTTVDKLHVEL